MRDGRGVFYGDEKEDDATWEEAARHQRNVEKQKRSPKNRIFLHYKGYVIDGNFCTTDLLGGENNILLVDNSMAQRIITHEDYNRIFSIINLDSFDTHHQVRFFPDIIRKDIPEKFSWEGEEESGFRGERVVIPECNLRIYWGTDMISLEEAEKCFEEKLYAGEYFHHGNDVGYSEYTITGFEFDKMVIGGHDLRAELLDKAGKYIHIVMEFPI